MTTNSDTLEAWLKFMAQEDLSDPRIFEIIVPIDKPKLKSAVSRFEKVQGLDANKRAAGKSKASWISQQNEAKGKCFELIMRVLLPPHTAFLPWQDVTTSTNELDFLVKLTTKSKCIRLFDKWGTHFICECKSEKGYFSVTWVDKLFSVLTTHNSYAGILVSQKGPSKTGGGRQATNKIRMLAIAGKVILVVDMEDIQECINGTHILTLLTDKYISTTTGASKFALL